MLFELNVLKLAVDDKTLLLILNRKGKNHTPWNNSTLYEEIKIGIY